MRRIFVSVFFAVASVLAQEAPVSVSQEPVSQDSVTPSVSQNTATTAPAAPKAVEPAPDSAALAVKLTEPDSVKVEKAPADSVKKGGLLDALFPVQPDEMISKGHAYAGATLSLIQANTEDDALNILIGDVYEAYGYTFTVEAFGGYFFRDAMAIGVRAGYSRTWFDIDFSILEDLMDVKEHRKYVSNGFFVQPLLKNYLKVLDSRLFYLFNETSALEAQRDAVSAKAQELSGFEKKVKSAADRLSSGQASAETFRVLVAGRASAAQRLSAVRSALAPGMWLEKWDQGRITVRYWKDSIRKSSGKTPEELVKDKLRGKPAVVDPDSVKISDMSEIGKNAQVAQFTVELKFK